jgi:hypothetical protein
MILTAVAAWIVLSVLMTVVCTAVVRGGVREDRMRGYVRDGARQNF